MTDYVVTEVRLKDDNEYESEELFAVKVLAFNNYKKKPFDTRPLVWTRQQLIGAMLEGKKFSTYYKCEDSNKYKLGGKIQIYKVNNQNFIKTEKNDVECDNLTNLPEF
jgi:hypothetical protein